IGPRTPEQLDNLLATEERSLPTPIVTALDDISGGPNNLREVSDNQIAK
ncbi:MAG: aldo/keto reductase, partial [Propionibacterium sp.]